MSKKLNTKAFYNPPIPDDWEIKELGQLFEFKNGINAGKESYGAGIKFINVMEVIYNDSITAEMIPGTVKITDEQKQLYLVKNGDVLFNRTSETVNEIGLTATYYGDEEVVFGGFVIRGRPINKCIDDKFKKYCFRSEMVRDQIIKGGQGAVRTNIGQGDLEKVKLALPPLPEQKAIADILHLIDTAINKNNLLIEKKLLQKRWLMQMLLTGKKRLKGFDCKWKEYHLGSLGNTYAGLTGKSKEDFGKGKPYIPYLNIFFNAKINPSHFDYVKITEQDNQNKVQYGDIFFTISSETPDEVGMASVLLEDFDELYLNSFCFGFRLYDFKTLMPEFSSYFLRADAFREEIYQLSQGATRFNLSKNNLMKLNVILPSIEEQTAIANVLQATEKEIQLLKAKSEKLGEKKKGLMQVLLTGKKRLTKKTKT
jgi:type I restriction enzyme S subunit